MTSASAVKSSHSSMEAAGHSSMKSSHSSVEAARHSMEAAEPMRSARAKRSAVKDVRRPVERAAHAVENPTMTKAGGSVEGAGVSQGSSMTEAGGSVESSCGPVRETRVADKGASSVNTSTGKAMRMSRCPEVRAVQGRRIDGSACDVANRGAEKMLRMDRGLGRESAVSKSGTAMARMGAGVRRPLPVSDAACMRRPVRRGAVADAMLG